VRLARDFDALVVTDNVYDVLRWFYNRSGHFDQLGDVPSRLIDVDRNLDGGPKDEWGYTMSNGSFPEIIAPGMRVGWVEATPAFILALSQVGATSSGGCPAHIAASFVHELLVPRSLDKQLKTQVLPTFRARYYSMLEATDTYLVSLGLQIFTGKLYDERTMESNETSNGVNSASKLEVTSSVCYC
jgi:DNA-binding transcriptional MocR family regulator